MTFKDLLACYNSMAEKQAGPKTFASRARLIERIRKLAADQNINLASFGQPKAAEVPEQHAQPPADAAEASEAATVTKEKRGSGVGELARSLLMDPAGYPHGLIAAMVNAEIPGAAATAKSVRWYACKMRKGGVQVPKRVKAFPAEMDAEQSAAWFATVKVVEPAPIDKG